MMENRYCVIMCGGVGSRFWPFSKSSAPKQFIDFFGTGRSLLQMSFDRVAEIVPVRNILAITNERYAPLVKQQLPDLADDQILLEPDRRNTAPCIAWAAYHIRAINPNAMMLVTPSDHLILKEDAFRDCVVKGFDFLSRQRRGLLTLGIKPNRPETGYGYIQISKDEVEDGITKVKTFTEKPNEELAKVFVQSGEFFWNSGIFLWSADAIIDAFHDHCPDGVYRLRVSSLPQHLHRLCGDGEEQRRLCGMRGHRLERPRLVGRILREVAKSGAPQRDPQLPHRAQQLREQHLRREKRETHRGVGSRRICCGRQRRHPAYLPTVGRAENQAIRQRSKDQFRRQIPIAGICRHDRADKPQVCPPFYVRLTDL